MNFSNFAEYKELTTLYNKVLPEMGKHEANMIEHRNDIKRFGEMIKRFDEVLSEKASKQDFRDIQNRIKEEYLSVKVLNDVKELTTKQMNHLGGRQDKLDQSFTLLSSQISQEIQRAVKKANATNTIKASTGYSGDLSMLEKDLKHLISLKADRVDLQDLHVSKTSK